MTPYYWINNWYYTSPSLLDIFSQNFGTRLYASNLIFFRNFVFFFQNYSITKFVSFRLSFPSKRGTVALTLTCVYISVRAHTHALTDQGQSQKRLERVIFWWRVHTERVSEARGPQKNPFSARAFDSWCWLRVSCNFEENRFFPRFPLSYRISLQLWHPTERWSLFEGRNLEKKKKFHCQFQPTAAWHELMHHASCKTSGKMHFPHLLTLGCQCVYGCWAVVNSIGPLKVHRRYKTYRVRKRMWKVPFS